MNDDGDCCCYWLTSVHRKIRERKQKHKKVSLGREEDDTNIDDVNVNDSTDPNE